MSSRSLPPQAAVLFSRSAPLLFALCLVFSLAAHTSAQNRREHLTPEEIEMVRENQALDGRTGVFIKAAERRMLAVTNPAESAKNAAKDKEWGELKGTREQFFYDIGKILDEAVVNIDDSAEHNPDSPLLRKSLYMLAQAAARILPELTRMREGAQSESELAQLERAIETVQEINDAAKERGVGAEDLKVKPPKKGN